jgi:asparaginyl-tRNA synthetase
MTPRQRLQLVLQIQSEIRHILADELRRQHFIEISPVILSPITDPLNHPTFPATISCYGKNYSVTQSMIFHKQLALKTIDRFFVFSPNIRLEESERASTGRHLFEFSQLDLEVKNATREDIMTLCEHLIVTVVRTIKRRCTHELVLLERKIPTPHAPFPHSTYTEALKKHGPDFETIISKTSKEPVWLIDIPLARREFYDREDPTNSGFLRDMDLLYPEGYGEALSGGEREYQFERIKTRILQKRQTLDQFKDYLDLAKDDLPASAGFGIGIERLTRYICGLERIEETTLFPKIPGKNCI